MLDALGRMFLGFLYFCAALLVWVSINAGNYGFAAFLSLMAVAQLKDMKK